MQQCVSRRLTTETNEHRDHCVQDLRLATETDKQRAHRLDEQRRRDIRRHSAVTMNILTYKCAVNADVLGHRLGLFNVVCIHSGTLHFPEERVSN